MSPVKSMCSITTTRDRERKKRNMTNDMPMSLVMFSVIKPVILSIRTARDRVNERERERES